jgi:hypothetical protein
VQALVPGATLASFAPLQRTTRRVCLVCTLFHGVVFPHELLKSPKRLDCDYVYGTQMATKDVTVFCFHICWPRSVNEAIHNTVSPSDRNVVNSDNLEGYVRFEVFAAVTMKNAVY